MRVTAEKIPLAGLSLTETEDLLVRRCTDTGYARRLLYWIYRRGIRSFSEISDVPKKVLSVLAESCSPGLTDPLSSVSSSDGSVKYLFMTRVGLPHETVYLPDGKRKTVCISVQSGCRMGCTYCATGRTGWKGNLTAGEIVNQVISIPHEVTHVVLMGMGEPGDNIEEVIRACRILTAEWGVAIGNNKVTVSTAGITPAVKRLLQETRCNITLSLYSPFVQERAAAMPAERLWPFRETLDLITSSSPGRRRRFTVAYMMIKGKNDTGKHLEGLKRLLSGTGIRVNLLPYHPTGDDSNCSSDSDTMMAFKHSLVTSGIGASVRRSRGGDISAACGMLAAGTKKTTSIINNRV